MIPTLLIGAMNSMLAYVPMIDPVPQKGTVYPTLLTIFFVLATIAVSVKWTKKTHQD
jgi:hypothetical protein